MVIHQQLFCYRACGKSTWVGCTTAIPVQTFAELALPVLTQCRLDRKAGPKPSSQIVSMLLTNWILSQNCGVSHASQSEESIAA